MSETVILRDARPDKAEGLAVARYMNEVAEGFFSLMLGRDAEEIIARTFVQPDNDYSYQNVIIAERDGAIVGMALGFSAAQRREHTDQPLKDAAGKSAARMKFVKTICAPMIRVLDNVPDGDFYLLFVAVDKELRGEGVGSRLIDALEERARATGAARLALDVAASNKAACRLYERRGMTVESQWPKHIRIPGLKLLRMTKPLDPNA